MKYDIQFTNQFKKDLKEKDYTETQREQIEQTIEDTEYQVRTAKEIVNVLNSARRKENIENAKKN